MRTLYVNKRLRESFMASSYFDSMECIVRRYSRNETHIAAGSGRRIREWNLHAPIELYLGGTQTIRAGISTACPLRRDSVLSQLLINYAGFVAWLVYAHTCPDIHECELCR